MKPHPLLVLPLTTFLLTGVAAGKRAVAFDMDMDERQAPARLPFSLLDPPLRPSAKRVVSSVPLAGSAIAVAGAHILVIDPDSGELVKLSGDTVVARLMIGAGSAQVVVDTAGRLAYVTDRANDRVVLVDVRSMKRAGAFATAAEPYGIALAPDGQTIYVTTVAEPALTAHTRATGDARWSIPLGNEPRGVAVSPDGKRASVSFLQLGAVARIENLEATPRVSYTSIEATPLPATGVVTPGQLPDAGRGFARNGFATLFLDDRIAVVGFQDSTPTMNAGRGENRGSYGGGGSFQPPIAYRLGFVDGEVAVRAHINASQPRALAHDPTTDVLYVAGYGSDTILAVADSSRPSLGLKGQYTIGGAACGPSGLAVQGHELVVYCELSRKVARLSLAGKQAGTVVSLSGEVAASRLSKVQLQGREIFRRNSTATSAQGAMACASCHPEGRTDGLSWRIEGNHMQTPLLGGRLAGTEPFKWDGKDATLKDSLKNTVVRLGGSGLNEQEAAALMAFVTQLPAPRAPSVDRVQAERGKSLFNSQSVGCMSCHSGPLYTNRKTRDLASDMKGVDTPSLVGLAHSAPYYHDGSARTLRAVLLENGSIHGMGDTSKLSDAQLDDLVAYLKTL
jgi:cytochrome c553